MPDKELQRREQQNCSANSPAAHVFVILYQACDESISDLAREEDLSLCGSGHG